MKRILLLVLCIFTCAFRLMSAPPRMETVTPDTWEAWLQAEQEMWQQMPTAASHLPYSRTAEHAAATQSASADAAVNTPFFLFPRVPVIMVNFSNYSFSTTKQQVDSMFNAVHWAEPNRRGSVAQYFDDQSYGAYHPVFDIYGPVTLSQDYAFYGAGLGRSAKPGYMVAEACVLMDDSLDFSQYDSNNDGYVDMVFVLFAGFGENDPPVSALISDPANLIWPNYWTLSMAGYGSHRVVFDGKTVNAYECANELDGYSSTVNNKVTAGIPVLVHEFSHGLGLRDMYTTNSSNHKTLGMWTLMDYCYGADGLNPPGMNAFEKWCLGWLEPEQLLDERSDTLPALASAPVARYLTPDGTSISSPTSSNRTFYMLENRQRIGWDATTRGNGLLLYKIMYSSGVWSSNTINNDSTRMGVDILEADGISVGYNTSNSRDTRWAGKQGDCYPYIANNDTLDSIVVVPSVPITHIRMENRLITYEVNAHNTPETPTHDIEVGTNQDRVCIMSNGRIYIRYEDTWYDLLGHKLENLQ